MAHIDLPIEYKCKLSWCVGYFLSTCVPEPEELARLAELLHDDDTHGV